MCMYICGCTCHSRCNLQKLLYGMWVLGIEPQFDAKHLYQLNHLNSPSNSNLAQAIVTTAVLPVWHFSI